MVKVLTSNNENEEGKISEEGSTIVAEFGTQEPEIVYTIEYQDAQGHWGSAAGKWNDSMSIKGEYTNKGMAVKIGESLWKISGRPTRIIEGKSTE